MRAPLLVGAGGLAALATLRVYDPHQSGSYGFCPFLLVTGRPCPGCGGLRAVNDLTHGEIGAAFGSNVLAVALVAVMGVAWIVWFARRWRGTPAPWVSIGARSGAVLVILILAFGIVRNTPWGAGLAP